MPPMVQNSIYERLGYCETEEETAKNRNKKFFQIAQNTSNPILSPTTKRNLELDLDFFERRQQNAPTTKSSSTATENQENPQSPIEISPESVDRIKVILLGAPMVGKSSIIQQFVWNDFTEEYIPTDKKLTYYPSVITNNRLYEIKITDLPVIPYFPVNSFYEWTDYRFFGLRNASAYILVFDLSNPESFQYVKTIREQIMESRNVSNVPVLIVGNKQDLIVNSEGVAAGGGGKPPAITSGSDERRREIVNVVKKQWKCTYVECSAKYNWRIVTVFKELISMIDNLDSRDQSPMLDNIQDALDRNKCVII
nr:ras-like protein family member 10B [Onthophagus taurus]